MQQQFVYVKWKLWKHCSWSKQCYNNRRNQHSIDVGWIFFLVVIEFSLIKRTFYARCVVHFFYIFIQRKLYTKVCIFINNPIFKIPFFIFVRNDVLFSSLFNPVIQKHMPHNEKKNEPKNTIFNFLRYA